MMSRTSRRLSHRLLITPAEGQDEGGPHRLHRLTLSPEEPDAVHALLPDAARWRRVVPGKAPTASSPIRSARLAALSQSKYALLGRDAGAGSCGRIYVMPSKASKWRLSHLLSALTPQYWQLEELGSARLYEEKAPSPFSDRRARGAIPAYWCVYGGAH